MMVVYVMLLLHWVLEVNVWNLFDRTGSDRPCLCPPQSLSQLLSQLTLFPHSIGRFGRVLLFLLSLSVFFSFFFFLLPLILLPA